MYVVMFMLLLYMYAVSQSDLTQSSCLLGTVTLRQMFEFSVLNVGYLLCCLNVVVVVLSKCRCWVE